METTSRGYVYPSDYNQNADVPKDMKILAYSIDKDVGDLEKTHNESQAKQDQKITALEQENEGLKSLLPTVIGEGESVTLNNTGTLGFKAIQIEGKTEQESVPNMVEEVPIKNITGTIEIKVENGEMESQTAGFTLAEGQFLHDTDYIDKNGIHFKKETYIFDGTETVTTSTNHNIRKFSVKNFVKENMEAHSDNYKVQKCNYFPTGSNYWSSDSMMMCLETNGTNCGFSMGDNPLNLNTVDEFKAWLKKIADEGHPLMFEWRLNEEKLVPFNETQQKEWEKIEKLKTYEDTTIITSEDVLKPKIKAEVYRKIETGKSIANEPQSELSNQPNSEPSYEEVE